MELCDLHVDQTKLAEVYMVGVWNATFQCFYCFVARTMSNVSSRTLIPFSATVEHQTAVKLSRL
jgi:hypothetical protein